MKEEFCTLPGTGTLGWVRAVELCQRIYYLMFHPFPILSTSCTVHRPGRRTKLRQEAVIDIMHLQRGNCSLICVLALFVKPSSKPKRSGNTFLKCIKKKKEKKEQAVFEFILQGLLFSDRLSDRRQCFHGAVPVGNQRREEFAAHCNKGLVRLESSWVFTEKQRHKTGLCSRDRQRAEGREGCSDPWTFGH